MSTSPAPGKVAPTRVARLAFTITIDAEDHQAARAATHVVHALREAGLIAADVAPRLAVDADLHIWPDARRVAHRGAPVGLTRLEFDLLLFLCGHPDRVHRRRDLMAAVWGIDDVRGMRTVDVHVRRLRRKLGDGVISTVRGVGYSVEDNGKVRVHDEAAEPYRRAG